MFDQQYSAEEVIATHTHTQNKQRSMIWNEHITKKSYKIRHENGHVKMTN